MRLPIDQSLPVIGAEETGYDRALSFQLNSVLRRIVQQLNQLSEGGITAVTNAATAAPTSGTWQVGDFIRNSAPAELGTALSKYVITGFICTVAGTPGTWKQSRVLTGN